MIKKYKGKSVYYVDTIACVFIYVHDNWALVEVIDTQDNTTKRAFIAKQDGFFAHGETIREAFTAVRDKVMESMDDEEKGMRFLEAFPEFEIPYRNADFFIWHKTITGSCEFGRKQFAEQHGIKLDGQMTVKQFIELTQDAFGGERIKEIATLYTK